jgi:hypothetical protein
MGSKTPIDSYELAVARLDAAAGEESPFCVRRVCHSVFNGLRAAAAANGKGLGCAVHYIRDGHVVRTRGARFGPNFVTIQPLGVCVCSF